MQDNNNNNKLVECPCCGKFVEEGGMYFGKGSFDTYKIVDGEYVYEGYLVCKDCHENGK